MNNYKNNCMICGGVHDAEDTTLLSQYACVKCGGTHGSDILDNRGWCLRDRRGFKITRKVIHSLPLIQDNGNWKPQPICEDCLRSVHGVMIYALTTNVVLAAKWNTEISCSPAPAPVPSLSPRKTKAEREQEKRENLIMMMNKDTRGRNSYKKRFTILTPEDTISADRAETDCYLKLQEKYGPEEALRRLREDTTEKILINGKIAVITVKRNGTRSVHAGPQDDNEIEAIAAVA